MCTINFPQIQGPHPWTQVFPTEIFKAISTLMLEQIIEKLYAKIPTLPRMTSVVQEFPKRKRF